MCTLCGHSDIVYVVCYIREGLLVSGSRDNCLVIWSKSQAVALPTPLERDSQDIDQPSGELLELVRER